MKNVFLTGVFLLFAISRSFAADNIADAWQKGNELYQQKKYDSAAVYFSRVAASRPHSTDVYYNLGNTYYRMDKIGLAILNYERALHADPDNKNAKANLLVAQNHMSNHVQEADTLFLVTWWDVLISASRQRTWALLSLLLFVAIVAVMWVRKKSNKAGARKVSPLLVTLGVVWLCTTVLAIASAANSAGDNSAVVMQEDAPLMMEARPGKAVSLIPEGTLVQIKGSKGSYIAVTLPDGRTGWMKQELVNKI